MAIETVAGIILLVAAVTYWVKALQEQQGKKDSGSLWQKTFHGGTVVGAADADEKMKM